MLCHCPRRIKEAILRYRPIHQARRMEERSGPGSLQSPNGNRNPKNRECYYQYPSDEEESSDVCGSGYGNHCDGIYAQWKRKSPPTQVEGHSVPAITGRHKNRHGEPEKTISQQSYGSDQSDAESYLTYLGKLC